MAVEQGERALKELLDRAELVLRPKQEELLQDGEVGASLPVRIQESVELQNFAELHGFRSLSKKVNRSVFAAHERPVELQPEHFAAFLKVKRSQQIVVDVELQRKTESKEELVWRSFSPTNLKALNWRVQKFWKPTTS